jgi:hypothetical protein
MDLRSGEIWPAGEARPHVDDLDEWDWTELGGIDRETGISTVDYGKATRGLRSARSSAGGGAGEAQLRPR